MNELTTFQFEEGRGVRTLEREGDVWFVAKDVAEALGYAKFDSHLLNHVPEEWKGTNPIRTPGGTQEMLCFSEQGLYFFLGRSDKDAALPFQKWVAGDIIPSIRKKGYYAVPQIQDRLDALFNTLAERLPFPMTKEAVQERADQLAAERERELEKRGIVNYSWNKPVTQFVCPFYGRSDVVSELTDLHGLLGKLEGIKAGLHRYVLQAETPEVIPETVADRVTGGQYPINLPLARFVAENLDFTLKDTDIIPVYVAYQVYLAYAAHPLGEGEFGLYIADRYPDITVTKRKADGMAQDILKRCRFRVTYGAFKAK